MVSTYAEYSRRRQFGILVTLSLFVLIFLGGETWAKWWPYSEKLVSVLSSRSWTHHSVFDSASKAGSGPSLQAGWQFLHAYVGAIWIALLAGLSIAAGIEAFFPRKWLIRAMTRSSNTRGSLVGGLLAIPCMMCTCCSAPITRSLVREGVPKPSALAYWVGNPTLNPAVLAFLAVVGPWQWVVVRIVAGSVLVFGATSLVAKMSSKDSSNDTTRAGLPSVEKTDDSARPSRLQDLPLTYLRAWVRFAVTLVPEYIVLVFLLGVFRGWLFPFGGNLAHWGFVLVLLAAIVGTLMVIPTAGEIPVLLSLAASGTSAGVLGALLITLPAISVPSMSMLGNGFGWRTVGLMAGAVAVMGLVSAGLLTILVSFH